VLREHQVVATGVTLECFRQKYLFTFLSHDSNAVTEPQLTAGFHSSVLHIWIRNQIKHEFNGLNKLLLDEEERYRFIFQLF
jgi:hypothetical protein